jgi:hypothetical protein
MKSNILKYMACAAVTLGLAATVQAVPITGGISMAGDYTVNTGNLNTATAFSSFSDVMVTSVAGSYLGAGITMNTPGSVTMSTFTFNPFPGGGVIPLWITTMGTLAQFDLTSLTSRIQTGNDALELRGTGILKLTGFDNTPGSWIFTANQGGGTFSFSSSNAAIPDGGVTAILLGAALSGLALIRRKLA